MNTIVLWGCLIPGLYLAYTDMTKRIIYDIVTIPMIIGGLVYGVYAGNLLQVLCGVVFGFTVSFVAAWVTNGGIGGGDIKLLTALGAWLGFWNLVSIILISVLLAVIWDVLRQLKNGRFKQVVSYRIVPKIRGLYFEYGLGIEGAMYKPEVVIDRQDSIPFGAFFIITAWLLQIYLGVL